jgi:hypothetical protein
LQGGLKILNQNNSDLLLKAYYRYHCNKTVIASEALHRPKPARFGAPHGVQGEAKQSPGLPRRPAVAGLLAMTTFGRVDVNYFMISVICVF